MVIFFQTIQYLPKLGRIKAVKSCEFLAVHIRKLPDFVFFSLLKKFRISVNLAGND